jgi:hypothetical protein
MSGKLLLSTSSSRPLPTTSGPANSQLSSSCSTGQSLSYLTSTSLTSGEALNSPVTLSGLQMASSPLAGSQQSGPLNSLQLNGSQTLTTNLQLTGTPFYNMQLSNSALSSLQLTPGVASSSQQGANNSSLFSNIQFPPGTVITLDTGQVLDWSQVSYIGLIIVHFRFRYIVFIHCTF